MAANPPVCVKCGYGTFDGAPLLDGRYVCNDVKMCHIRQQPGHHTVDLSGDYTFEDYLHKTIPALMRQNVWRRIGSRLCPRQTMHYVVWRDTRKNLRILREREQMCPACGGTYSGKHNCNAY